MELMPEGQDRDREEIAIEEDENEFVIMRERISGEKRALREIGGISQSDAVIEDLRESLAAKVEVLEEASEQMAENQDHIAGLEAELAFLREKAATGQLETQGPVLVLAEHELGSPHGQAEYNRHNPSHCDAGKVM